MILSADYFFDRNGLPIMNRHLTHNRQTDGVYVRKQGELQLEYSLSQIQGYLFLESNPMCVIFSDPGEASGSFVIDHSQSSMMDDSISLSEMGQSRIVRMARPWIKNAPKPPGIDFLNAKDQFIKKNWDCYRVFDLSGFRILDQGQPNKLVFVNKEGEREYEVVWDTVMELNSDGDEVPFFVVTQSHLEDGEVKEQKILKSPIQIDMKKAKSALLSKPPYPEDENGRLVVPWRNIDRIVGASLSNSYPPQARQR